MAKKSEPVKDEENIGAVGQTPLVVHKQYLKDLSFESPNSPGILVPSQIRPEMDMNILLDVKKVKNEEKGQFYEVIMTVSASAKREDKTLFLVEVIYAAMVSVEGLDEKKHHPLLFIEVPQMMFPYARQIVSHATQSGGFTPLNLAPVDFRSMYVTRFAEAKENADAQKN